jgi:hypothetical protein
MDKYVARWTMRVEFESLDEAAARGSDIGADFPEGPAQGFCEFVRGEWPIDIPEDEEFLERDGDTVTCHSDVVDAFEDAFRWVIMYTTPKRLELVCNDLSR